MVPFLMMNLAPLLAGMHTVRNPFVEVGGAYDSLDSDEPHILSDIIAYTGESNGDALIL